MRFTLLNDEIDIIQGAYQSFTSMIKDFNETRTWPIDNAQKLITMDDKYVSLLQIEVD